MSEKLIKRLVILAVTIIILMVAGVIFMDVENVEGYETGVIYKWFGGVQDNTKDPGLRCVFMGKLYNTNLGLQKLTFGDEKGIKTQKNSGDINENDFAPIEVNCGKGGGQKAWIHISLLYHLEKDNAIQLWRDGIGKNYRYVVLKRSIVDAVNKSTRIKEALDIYSGEGFNDLQIEIEDLLKNDKELKYFVVDQVTIYQIRLRGNYEKEIEDKQLAIQQKLRAKEETLAAREQAKKTAAEAKVMVEQKTAEAEAAKITVVTNAEAENERRILLAEAAKQEQTLKGEGEKLRKLAEAAGVEALGLADAQVQEAMKNAMYEGEAGRLRANVTVAMKLSEKLQGLLKGIKIVPKDAIVTVGNTNVPLSITDQGVRNSN